MPVLPKSEEKNVNQYTLGLYDQIGLFPIKQITKSMNALFEPIRIQMKAMNQLFDGIRKAAEVVRNFFDNFIRNIRETFQAFFNPINNILKNTFAFIHRLWESNFFLIVKASEGDKIALHKLGKLWWKLIKMYFEIERRKGRNPTKEEFHQLVHTACWEVLKENREKPIGIIMTLARIVYYSIIVKLLVDYIEVINVGKTSHSPEIEIVSTHYKSRVSIYYDDQNNPNLFVKTAAEAIGVSSQTIRNWIKSGKVKAIQISYFSRIRNAKIPVYLLPYESNLLSELEALKKEQENKKLHRREGYLTISQITRNIPISRKTLERWDKEGRLVPKRINGIRYYLVDEAKTILSQSQNPRVKSFVLEENLAPILAS